MLSQADKPKRSTRRASDGRGNVLRHLIEGGDLSQWGMVNAITRSAEDATSYDRAVELEEIGWKVVELEEKDWSAIACK